MILATSISKSIILVIGILSVVTLLLILMLLFVKENYLLQDLLKLVLTGKGKLKLILGILYLQHLVLKRYFYHLHVEEEVPVFNVNVILILVEERHYQQKPRTLLERSCSLVLDLHVK